MIKSDGTDSRTQQPTAFLGLWPESMWLEPRPRNRVHSWLGKEATRTASKSLVLWGNPKVSQKVFGKC